MGDKDFVGIDWKDMNSLTWSYKIVGSILTVGKDFKVTIKVDQQFNKFQKLMWKWCFGIKVEDYMGDL